MLFSIPLVKQLVSWMGGIRADRAAIKKVLRRPREGSGGFLDGIAGMFESGGGGRDEVFALGARSGAFRLAVEHGVVVMGGYCFGATDIMSAWHGARRRARRRAVTPRGRRRLGGALVRVGRRFVRRRARTTAAAQRSRRFEIVSRLCPTHQSRRQWRATHPHCPPRVQRPPLFTATPTMRPSLLADRSTGVMKSLSRRWRVSLLVPHGRWFLPVPRRAPLVLVYAPPVEAPRDEHPTDEAVAAVRRAFLGRVRQAFETGKKLYGWDDRRLIIK